jgi:putative ABC transport system permease protein
MIGRALGWVGVGVALGIPGAAGLSRLIRAQLYATQPFDAVVFAVVPLLLAGVAGLAGYVPASRAAAVDPASALREEV